MIIMNNRFKFTLKAWPVIAIATIALCFLTEACAGWLGIELPEQKNVELVRLIFKDALQSWRHFGVCAFNLALIVAILPFVEEGIFRWGFFKMVLLGKLGLERPTSLILAAALESSVLFSAAHYISQPWPDNAFIALFFFGLAQCWLYRRTESLWCTVLNHALFNLTNLILLLILPTQV